MLYHDHYAFAKLRQQEVEKQARHAWKFFERTETKKISVPATSRRDPKCCVNPTPCNA